MNDSLTFIEMFCGIGGFRLGLERSGWRCVWANDNDKYANQAYTKNFGKGELVSGDIRQVDVNGIPNHTLLSAGFPCQAFSVAGKRKGFEDARGTLFYHIARVAEAKGPKLLLLENVKGLLSAQGGYCFWRILETLDELGYLLEWQVLNSKHFGVPQNRERVFLVGHLGKKGSRQIFPIGKCDQEDDRECIQVNKPRHSYYRFYDANGISPCHRSSTGNKVPKIVVANAVDCDGYLRFGQRPRDDDGKPQLLPIGYRRIRRLTPVECERLQGFPDGWTEGVSDTQRYKLLGNAVTVNVIEFLGNKLLECLK